MLMLMNEKGIKRNFATSDFRLSQNSEATFVFPQHGGDVDVMDTSFLYVENRKEKMH